MIYRRCMDPDQILRLPKRQGEIALDMRAAYATPEDRAFAAGRESISEGTPRPDWIGNKYDEHYKRGRQFQRHYKKVRRTA